MAIELEELRELLERLGDQATSISYTRLYPLSDLAGERWDEFRGAWSAFPVDLRQRLMRALVELAEASFEVNFDTIFRHGLHDPDDQIRALAIDGLWENEDVNLVGPMLTMLRADPSARVRAAAASGLGRFVLAGELDKLAQPIQERIVTELLTAIHLADESVEVQRRAVESVAYACRPEVAEALEIAYYHEDEKMRISAVTGMGRSCDTQWSDIVLQELDSSSPAMRYEAAWASGELMLQKAVVPLARMIQDADPQVSSACIWALGQISGSRAKQALFDAYEDADAHMREAIEEALAEHALVDGDLDLTLYSLDEDLDEAMLDDDLYVLWSADDDDDKGLDRDNGEFDER